MYVGNHAWPYLYEGNVGVIGRSGTLGYEVAQQMKDLGIGISTSVGIGGDPINGSAFKDHLEKFGKDDETKVILMIGEIGGPQEAEAAEYAKEHVSKPVIAYIAGLTAPKVKEWDMLAQSSVLEVNQLLRR